jgi:hypothetical protein
MRLAITALLWLFPAGFRRHYGAALLATFEDRWRAQHGVGIAFRTILDLLRSAFLERISAWGGNRRIPAYKGDRLMTTLWHDVRYAVRTLAKTPGFTIAAVATLALGIGANTAIYSVVDAVLLKGLPYPHADRLVFISESLPTAPMINVSWPDFLDWRAQNEAFSDIAIFQPSRASFAASEGAKSLPAGWVSGSFFSLLGAKPMLGRAFGAQDDRPGADPVVVLSYRCWRNELKADPQIVGKEIAIENGAFTVAGVLPPDFQFQPFESISTCPSGGVPKSPASSIAPTIPG